MAEIRVATFNVENLLRRFDFYRYGRLTAEPSLAILGVEEDDKDYFLLRRALFVTQTDDGRQMTSQAIRDTNADIVCLQEVDNLRVLNDFHEQYLRKSANVHYGWRRLIEGNDNRGIDVAVMGREWLTVTSHAHHTFHDFELFNQELADYGLSEGDYIFRRDCLEVETNADGQDFFIFVCHFKSMSGGRDATIPVRRAEAAAVRRIIEDKWPQDHDQRNWVIAGDLNDYVVDSNGQQIPNGLEPLFEDNFSVNLVENLPASERWTHYYTGDGTRNQLDYILASPAIAAKNPSVLPDIVRNGQPYRVPGTDNIIRYARVGYDRPKASDHCPVAVTLTI